MLGNWLHRFALVVVIAFPTGSQAEDEQTSEDEIEEIDVLAEPPAGPALPENRARTQITREDLQLRLPRSAPDSLRFEPGVFVQQTAHGQGSAFIRGLTGQQTLLLFDGVRLNNSTYRQGPNQYFFTLDSQTIQSIQVMRGGASTRYGSDALGGVIMACPIEALIPEKPPGQQLSWDPHLLLRGATADHEFGGRLQTQISLGEHLGFFGGVGNRTAGLLESGGPVRNPADGEIPLVPRFESDGRTQKGTGFREFTADSRLALRIDDQHAVKLAAYFYRQFDSPRTDQCPAAFAPYDECLNYDNQFRTLVYAVYEGEPDRAGLRKLRATLSWQQQFERRTLNRPSSQVQNIGRDVVDTLGLSCQAEAGFPFPEAGVDLDLHYGLDTYFDRVQSAAWISFLDTGDTLRRSRGQYLDGSTYLTGGLFSEIHLHLADGHLSLLGGGRLSWVQALADSDPDSGTRPVDRSWFPVVGNIGLRWKVLDWLSIHANLDRSYRAPNLDDMTSRQQTGPGFQFENPALMPEKALTAELGVRFTNTILAELWVFHTRITDAILRSPREDADCPPETPNCQASWNKFQLVNAGGDSRIFGVEAALLAILPWGLEARSTVAWTWGDGPNTADPPSDPAIAYRERLPLSRIPPLNGTLELQWRHACGLTLGSAMRWALLQDRLALADMSDARIPTGGTPGFAVLDLRLTYRFKDSLMLSLTAENLTDEAYRYHGSSVNGPGRGLMLLVDLGPLWRL